MRFTVTCFFCLLLSFSSFARYEQLLHKKYAERYEAIDSLFYYTDLLGSDSIHFYRIVNDLTTTAKEGRDIELLCEAKLLIITYNMVGGQKRPYLVQLQVEEVIVLAKKYKLLQIEVRARQFLARYYFQMNGQYMQGLDEYINSYYIMQKLTSEEFPTKREHLYNIVHAYYNFGDYSQAKKYLLEADKIKLAGYIRKKGIVLYTTMKNTLGLIYRNEKNYDSAIYNFTIAKKLAEKESDSTWIGIASGNIGICYYQLGKYDQAIPLLEEDVHHSITHGELDNGINSLVILTDIWLRQKKYDNVKQGIEKARLLIAKTVDPGQHLLKLYPVMAEYYAATGNMALAYAYSDSTRHVEVLIDKKKDALGLARSEQQIQLQNHKAELKEMEYNRKLDVSRRNFLLLFTLAISVVVLLLINRNRIRHIFQRERAEADARHYKANAQRQLVTFTRSIEEKNELIEKFSAELEKYRTQAPSELILEELKNTVILTDDQWTDFQNTFEEAYPKYITRLNDKLPSLTQADIRYILLTRLKLNNKQMAGMLGVSIEATRIAKHRLLKKIDLPENQTLDEYFQQI